MLTNNTMQERGRAIEDEYFHRQEQALLARARERNAQEAARQRLAAVTGHQNAAWLDELHALGYTPDTAVLLFIAPLAQVAWADGLASNREQMVILESAKARGIDEHHAAFQELTAWLRERPPEEFFIRTLHLLAQRLETLPEAERSREAQTLLEDCEAVAQASGSPGFLSQWLSKVSAEERALLEWFRAQLRGEDARVA